MFLQETGITGQSTVADTVGRHYRTANVFRKYGIEYCCGARWPLSTVCMMKGIGEKELLAELEKASRIVQLPAALPFDRWRIDFLTDYIINVHHTYLADLFPALENSLTAFVKEHARKYPQLAELTDVFHLLHHEGLSQLRYEEEVIFPYLRQVAHAGEDKDSLAAQLVRILRKPIARVPEQGHQIFMARLYTIRQLTDNYTPPAKACTSHRVIFAQLRELDNDVIQHMYLENEILFSRIISIEKELLDNKQ